MSSEVESKGSRGPLFWLAVILLATLVAYSLYLAGTRIIQVDEAQQIYQSAVLARGQSAQYYTHAPLHHLGPMAWIARSCTRAADVFFWNRILYLGVFWANLALLAWLPERRLRSTRYLGWLLVAATLAPLWDYGFEARHDNLVLTGILWLWALGRSEGAPSRRAFIGMGVLSVLLQFIAFKSFMYWLPMSLAFILLPQPGAREHRWARLVAWGAGLGAALLLVGLLYWMTGAMQAFIHGFQVALTWSRAAERFSPAPTLARMVAEAPGLTAIGLGFLCAGVARALEDGRSRWSWDSDLPELGLLLLAMTAFLANPTPFPYNLLFVAPFVFLGAARLATRLERPLGSLPQWGWMLAGVVLIVHAYPFARATLRHLDFPNSRQELLMDTAEALTDRDSDPVYDGVGLVPTRPSIGYHWWLHTFTIQQFRNGTFPPVRQMLQERPAPVILTSYRTDWLAKEDHQFIAEHYLPLADDFLILGNRLPPGGGAWSCLKAGRYVLLSASAAPGSLPEGAEFDGSLLKAGEPFLAGVGPHRVQAREGVRLAIAWIGPKLNRLPALPPAEHQQLFINWY